MAKRKEALVLGGLAAAALLFSGRKASAKSKKPSEDDEQKDSSEEEMDEEDIDYEDILEDWEHPDGKASLGRLYQIKPGDYPFAICREALFGNRGAVQDPVLHKAVIDLHVLIDCGPWNQTLYKVNPNRLDTKHYAVDRGYTNGAISFNPYYADNRHRIKNGLKPTAEPGGNFAYIWIPMIDLDIFEQTGIVTVKGMNYPDSEEYGMGYSMIDPPPEILDMGFASISGQDVGCELPDGDFRKTLEPNG